MRLCQACGAAELKVSLRLTVEKKESKQRAQERKETTVESHNKRQNLDRYKDYSGKGKAWFAACIQGAIYGWRSVYGNWTLLVCKEGKYQGEQGYS